MAANPLTLVPFDEEWPSPNLSRIGHQRTERVCVLAALGDLLDGGFLTPDEVADCMHLVMKVEVEVSAAQDLLAARKSMSAQAQFLKLYLYHPGKSLSYATPWQQGSGIYQPGATPIVATPFFEFVGSPADRSSSPTLLVPTAIRPTQDAKMGCIKEADDETKHSPQPLARETTAQSTPTTCTSGDSEGYPEAGVSPKIVNTV